MKEAHKKWIFRVSWMLVGGILVIGLCIAAGLNEEFGNPISRSIAEKKIKAYAEKEYGDLNYTLTETSYGAADYSSLLRSRDSKDTWFRIHTTVMAKPYDDYEDTVLGMVNTLERIENEYEKIMEDIISIEGVSLEVASSETDGGDEEDYVKTLNLDQPFSANCGVDFTLYIETTSPEFMDTAKQEQVIEEIYAAVKKHGYKFLTYEFCIDLEKDNRYLYVEEITPKIIETGKLGQYLKEAMREEG